MFRLGCLLLVVGLCALSGPMPEGGANAADNCDNWCRVRNRGWECKAGGGRGCWSTVYGTCWWCIGPNRCKPNGDTGTWTCRYYTPPDNFLYWAEDCELLCNCLPATQNVEATGGTDLPDPTPCTRSYCSLF